MQKLYQDKLGDGMIELIKDSGAIDPATLNPSKVFRLNIMNYEAILVAILKHKIRAICKSHMLNLTLMSGKIRRELLSMIGSLTFVSLLHVHCKAEIF